MQSVCPSPGCGAAYTLSPQHLGRQFVCRKCGATLAAEAHGLRLAAPAAAGTPAAPSAAAAYVPADSAQSEIPAFNPSTPAPAVRKRRSAMGNPLLDRLTGDPFTWAFGVGSVIVIFFLFMPILDSQKVERRQATISSGDLTQTRLDREARQKDRDGVKRTAAEIDEAKKRRDAWDTEKASLEEDVDQAKIDADTSRYWYTWGTLIGFLILAVAALGYMSPQQTTARKVTGCIIVCAILLLVFFRILVK